MKSSNPSYSFEHKDGTGLTRNDQPDKSVKVAEVIDRFLSDKRLQGLSDRTLDQYEEVLGWFSDFLDVEEVLISEIDEVAVKKYLNGLIDRGLKITTVAIRFRVLRSFFNWTEDRGLIDRSPMEDIQEPKTPKKFPYVLDEEEVDQLLETAKSYTNKWTGIRDYTMVLLLLDAGLRATEILEAKKENLNLERRSLKINGKGAKDRKVFFGTQTCRWIKQWLQVREDISNPVVEKILFVDLNGNQIKQRNLTRIINRLQKRANLEDTKLSPHVLRHTAATMAVNNGLDVYSLQQMMGHEQLETSMRYVHMSGRRLEEATKKTSPIDHL